MSIERVTQTQSRSFRINYHRNIEMDNTPYPHFYTYIFS